MSIWRRGPILAVTACGLLVFSSCNRALTSDLTSDIQLAERLRVLTPVGSSIDDAKRMLEHDGFECIAAKSDSPQLARPSRLTLQCARSESSLRIPLMHRWSVLYQADSNSVVSLDVRMSSSWP